ncbi:dihydrolipoyl dehydrogenase [Komagataeibacter nataicola]|uniref:Dihydrolipoyl dehydrogenase n=1 Tax=Komagataeibacter nataicola TaxID=265960 RepID=A0A9N7CFP3_9PROT|nr:dihydrolipoyl dehydrogenase [Komagataeibacter nataicola]AQU86660.1 dihydrolipoyl dehydrogenase [Komagataeibacter nataicola]PYD66813.1 dihydrolipoyl dehydrogenase [Komagataeibacter nataicola]WEQ56396.1 dihydrolipoyl dehydrogenase [Komagataeibacter nataicola]WNM07954.1 dihydrolipoyl dehydrogenase [Komagataeibacter nataicola]GBR22334.1 dihydrolipoamide dehydrogenase [Komagataeibacter nataicola NRIC 0616]
MSTTQFDVIVIGGGPGGYVAAIRAAQLKLKVAVVEASQLGGICLNWGCIPTKALLRASEINHLLHNLGAFGFAADNVRFDFDKVIKRSRAVSAQLSGGVAHLLKKHKVTVINGFGRLAGTAGANRKVSVSVEGRETTVLTAPNVIVATGARARVLPGLEPDGKLVWSYREAMVPKAMPRSLLVIGSGAIGVEFASFYRNMGAEVTIVEVADRILPVEDAEISGFARKALEKQGMKILTGAKLGKITKGDNSVTIEVSAGGKTTPITVERVISAVGIVGNVENIGLEGTAIKVERTHITVDPYCRTGEKGVFAIGDIAAPPWLAHKASHEGVMVAELIAGHEVHPISPMNIPGCTYCRPQVASVGLSEEKAKAAGYKIRVGRFPFIGNGKAIAMGEPEGMVKTIFDDATGELLGAHMVGAEVTEMIQGYVIARTGELTDGELKETVFPHPTISETMHEAVLAAYDGALHI